MAIENIFTIFFKIFQITLCISVALFIWKKVNSPTKKEVSLGTLGTVQS